MSRFPTNNDIPSSNNTSNGNTNTFFQSQPSNLQLRNSPVPTFQQNQNPSIVGGQMIRGAETTIGSSSSSPGARTNGISIGNNNNNGATMVPIPNQAGYQYQRPLFNNGMRNTSSGSVIGNLTNATGATGPSPAYGARATNANNSSIGNNNNAVMLAPSQFGTQYQAPLFNGITNPASVVGHELVSGIGTSTGSSSGAVGNNNGNSIANYNNNNVGMFLKNEVATANNNYYNTRGQSMMLGSAQDSEAQQALMMRNLRSGIPETMQPIPPRYEQPLNKRSYEGVAPSSIISTSSLPSSNSSSFLQQQQQQQPLNKQLRISAPRSNSSFSGSTLSRSTSLLQGANQPFRFGSLLIGSNVGGTNDDMVQMVTNSLISMDGTQNPNPMDSNHPSSSAAGLNGTAASNGAGTNASYSIGNNNVEVFPNNIMQSNHPSGSAGGMIIGTASNNGAGTNANYSIGNNNVEVFPNSHMQSNHPSSYAGWSGNAANIGQSSYSNNSIGNNNGAIFSNNSLMHGNHPSSSSRWSGTAGNIGQYSNPNNSIGNNNGAIFPNNGFMHGNHPSSFAGTASNNGAGTNIANSSIENINGAMFPINNSLMPSNNAHGGVPVSGNYGAGANVNNSIGNNNGAFLPNPSLRQSNTSSLGGFTENGTRTIAGVGINGNSIGNNGATFQNQGTNHVQQSPMLLQGVTGQVLQATRGQQNQLNVNINNVQQFNDEQYCPPSPSFFDDIRFPFYSSPSNSERQVSSSPLPETTTVQEESQAQAQEAAVTPPPPPPRQQAHQLDIEIIHILSSDDEDDDNDHNHNDQISDDHHDHMNDDHRDDHHSSDDNHHDRHSDDDHHDHDHINDDHHDDHINDDDHNDNHREEEDALIDNHNFPQSPTLTLVPRNDSSSQGGMVVSERQGGLDQQGTNVDSTIQNLPSSAGNNDPQVLVNGSSSPDFCLTDYLEESHAVEIESNWIGNLM